jgi:hypothetical protein
MEKELEELSAFFEDKKHILNLATLSDKSGMNRDVLMSIFRYLLSPEENDKYKGIISGLENHKRLKSIAMIMEA